MITEPMHVAIPTAFYDNEELNTTRTIEFIKYLYKNGIESVLVCGTTGEQHSLSLDEKIELVNALNEDDIVNHMEIIFGVSSIRQKEAEKIAEAINQTNISGIMLGFPPYIKPSQNEAINYAKAIIAIADKETILYNNPSRTGFDLSTEATIELSSIINVIGIKDDGDNTKLTTLKKNIKKPFFYYAGGELGFKEKVDIGYNRLSSIVGNIYPVEITNWFKRILNKNDIAMNELEIIEKQITESFKGNVIFNIKKAHNQKSFHLGPCRTPIGHYN